MDEYKEALEIWEQMKRRKYQEGHIQNAIDSGRRFSGGDVADEDYARNCFLQAIAMTMFNESINRRVNEAKRSWGIK